MSTLIRNDRHVRTGYDAIPFSGSPHVLRSSAALGWQGFGAELIAFPAGVYAVPASTAHRVAVHVGAPVKARCRCAERRSSRIQAHGDADVIPAGVDGEWIDETDSTILRIWIGELFARATVESLDLKPSRARIHPQLQLRDPRLQHLAWALQAELESDMPSDPLYAESLLTAITVRLVGGAPTFERRRRVLAPRTAARVIDYIETHLNERLTLTELAGLSGLSLPHFKVLFRETLGVPVHRYVVQRRVERARMLLQQGRLSAAQIALEAGFSHQSHMAQWMSRLIGVGPREITQSAKAFDEKSTHSAINRQSD